MINYVHVVFVIWLHSFIFLSSFGWLCSPVGVELPMAANIIKFVIWPFELLVLSICCYMSCCLYLHVFCSVLVCRWLKPLMLSFLSVILLSIHSEGQCLCIGGGGGDDAVIITIFFLSNSNISSTDDCIKYLIFVATDKLSIKWHSQA